MKLSTKILIGILVSLVLVNGLWVVYDIRKEIQINKELADKEIKVNDQIILDIYRNLNNINKNIDKNYQDINQKIKDIPQKERIAKINLEQILKQVNVMIINKTIGAQGSGVSFKYKNKFYVLTAGHMLDSLTDEIYLYENKKQICRLEVIKHDFATNEDGEIDTTKNDLLLLRPNNLDIKPRFYVELAENEPITGTQIYIVGNPMGIEDVISDGRVISYKNNFMYYLDHTYFGNSGGGVYNLEGKLIGIVSHLSNLKPQFNYPDYVINGAVRIDTIVNFLRDIP